ncbi:hypothetical protein JOB18_042134 [Solea senegalensis]|uniref:Uncharacterized protein n=1 Tax=Solea senegalensis TaxID=28829 RepID=A0AAV6S6V3_SOLSE|nr:hypothetical protein JOB18_042134 [Solea senegalensis]
MEKTGGYDRILFFYQLNHLVAPDFYCRGWGVSIHWRAAEFIYKGCGQVCWENSHSFRSVRPNDIG